MDKKILVIDMITLSTQPPTYPLKMPKNVPIATVNIADKKAILKTELVPAITCLKTSLPSQSVPNGCALEGVKYLFTKLVDLSYGKIIGPKILRRTKNITMEKPIMVFLDENIFFKVPKKPNQRSLRYINAEWRNTLNLLLFSSIVISPSPLGR